MTTRSPQFSPCQHRCPRARADVDWTRGLWRELHAFASGQVYDPTNLFRVNQNIAPTEPQED